MVGGLDCQGTKTVVVNTTLYTDCYPYCLDRILHRRCCWRCAVSCLSRSMPRHEEALLLINSAH